MFNNIGTRYKIYAQLYTSSFLIITGRNLPIKIISGGLAPHQCTDWPRKLNILSPFFTTFASKQSLNHCIENLIPGAARVGPKARSAAAIVKSRACARIKLAVAAVD